MTTTININDIRAVRYVDFDGNPVTARFDPGVKDGVPHIVFRDADNHTLFSPITSETTWQTFVLGLLNDSTSKMEVIE